jgi:hypothetical protein
LVSEVVAVASAVVIAVAGVAVVVVVEDEAVDLGVELLVTRRKIGCPSPSLVAL